MPMIDDILAERDRASGILDDRITAAIRLRNMGADDLDDQIETLSQQKAEISAQAYEAALDDPTMIAALDALRKATKSMTSTAAKMTTATSFLANFDSFLAAAQQIIPVLKGQAAAA